MTHTDALIAAAYAAAPRDAALAAAVAEHQRIEALMAALIAPTRPLSVVGPRGRAKISAKEAAMLRTLAAASPGLVTRGELQAAVWPEVREIGHTIETHMYRLRIALQVAHAPARIVTHPRAWSLGWDREAGASS